MTQPPSGTTPDTQQTQADVAPQIEPSAEQTLAALLGDLGELRDYLTQRGRHTYDLAQKFLDSAKRSQATRAYDERQATMLEYQHYIWLEIAGLVDKLVGVYSASDVTAAQDDDAHTPGDAAPDGAAHPAAGAS